MSEEYIVDVDPCDDPLPIWPVVKKVDNPKEYVIRLLKHQLMFQEFLFAVKVSLKIRPGEAWGLIGINGSGKSTLLKAISGIMKPYGRKP